MSVVSAFLVPGSPLPMVKRDNPPWGALAEAMEVAGERLRASSPDTVLVYSTQWFAVLDELWQTRAHSIGTHVDENWHEFGDLPFDIRADQEMAEACIAAAIEAGVKSKAVDYDHFPIDTGTIVAKQFLVGDADIPLVICANNLYHDGETTETIARVATEQGDRLGRRIAVVGVGGLSGSFFRHEIDIADDHIASAAEDEWNRRVLDLIASADVAGLRAAWPDYAKEAKADMGFKQMAFVLGALGGGYASAEVLGYGPLYGTGGAVVHITPNG